MENEKEAQLQAFLTSLPETKAATLVRALERDRLAGDGKLPHEQIIEGLRPALRKTAGSAQRTPTPMRLFCTPFEDLLINAPAGARKIPGRIRRQSIMPVWTWLETKVVPDLFHELSAKITKAILDGDHTTMWAEAAILCGAAGGTIQSKLEKAPVDSAPYRALVTEIGSEAAVEDLDDMSKCLEIAAEVQQLQREFARGYESFDAEDVAIVRQIYNTISDHLPAHAPYLLLVLAGRLAEPWEALRVASRLGDAKDSVFISKTDLAIIGEMLVGDVEAIAADLAGDKNGRLALRPADEMLKRLEIFIRLQKGTAQVMADLREMDWQKRVVSTKAKVSEVLERLLEKTPKTIYGALPVNMLGGFGKGGAKPPRGFKKADPESCERARDLAGLTAGLRFLASELAVSRTYGDVTADIDRYMEKYCEDMVTALRNIRSDEERDVLLSYFGVAHDLLKKLTGEQEAELFRRRGLAALEPSEDSAA